MKIPPFLKQIILECAVSGNEGRLLDLLIDKLSPYGKITKTRWTDFFCSFQNKKNLPNLVVTAHMDSPGFILKEILSDGSLRLIALGGIQAQNMHLRQIKLQTSKGKIFPGVLHRVGDAGGLHTEYEGFFGFQNATEAIKKGIQLGDRACFDGPIIHLANDYISAPHLDNRVGCYLLVEIAKKLHKTSLPFNLHFAATSCEEMGGRGAKIIGGMLEPTIAICLDATYDDAPVEIEKGPVLTLSDRSTQLPNDLRDHLLKIAKKAKIPFQMEVYNYAGTDAEGFRDVGKGCLTIPLLIATKNNHTPFEIMSLKDLKWMSQYVIALLKDCKGLL